LGKATGWTAVRRSPPILWDFPDSELRISLDLILAHYRQFHPDVFFLQVGAFDGVAGDPLYPLVEKHGLRGVLVEPQKDAFEKLRTHYEKFGARFTLVNAAIAAKDGKVPLYRIKPGATGPEWLPQIASLDRKTVLRHELAVPNIESLVVVEEVQSLTFTSLFKNAGITRVDLLQIDTEGYDAEMLRLFDLGSRRPPIVRFEHKHLSREVHENCIRELIGLGYKLALSEGDTLAYLFA
jgi:FkbM family methyltransferase